MSARRGFRFSPAVRDQLGPRAERQERLGRYLPYVSALRDDVILTRQGDVMASVVLDGIDSYTASDGEIGEIAEGLARIVRQLGERFGFHVNKLARPDAVRLPPPDLAPFAEAVDSLWQASLSRRTLKTRVIVLTLLLRPTITSRLPSLTTQSADIARADIARRAAELEEAMALLSSFFSSVGARRLTVSSGEWLSLLAGVLGQDAGPVRVEPGDLLSETMTNFDVTFRGKVIEIEDGRAGRFGTVFGLKSYPSKTWPGMLDALDLPYDICVSHSFTPRRDNAMVAKVQRAYRVRGASEDAAISLTGDLVTAADEIASGRATFGDHHCSISVFCDSEEELERAAAEIWRAGQQAGAMLVRETWAAQPPYFAQLPGNWSMRTREGTISSHNFAGLAAFHRVQPGRPASQSPWGVNITAFPTVASSAYIFNFHEKGNRRDEPSVGHTLVLGRTGSGKTIGTAFLLAQARRTDARIIVFDKDQGLEMAVRALGGSYSEIKTGAPTGFNPFATETDDRGEAWLIEWLTDILSRTRPLEAMQSTAIAGAVRQIVRADARLRTFDALAKVLNATDDDGDLVTRVREWTAEGRYGWLFSKPAETAIAIGEDVVGIDMTELLDQAAERSALLAYLFRRIERVIEDRRPTLIVIDEAWKMLADDMFVKRLNDWLVTMRKRNCAVVMLTQTPGHLEQSSVGQIIAESVATQILYPNPRANPEDYAILRLNPREAEFVSQSSGGERLALVRSGPDSVIVNMDLSGLGGLVTVLGGGKTGEERAPAGWRQNPDFWKEMA